MGATLWTHQVQASRVTLGLEGAASSTRAPGPYADLTSSASDLGGPQSRAPGAAGGEDLRAQEGAGVSPGGADHCPATEGRSGEREGDPARDPGPGTPPGPLPPTSMCRPAPRPPCHLSWRQPQCPVGAPTVEPPPLSLQRVHLHEGGRSPSPAPIALPERRLCPCSCKSLLAFPSG